MYHDARHAMHAVSSVPVMVILSTYNGERFLHAQLASFLDQKHANWSLFWRDDGSSDSTVAIMRDFAAILPPGRCVESPGSGPHLGAAPSFLALLRECAGHGCTAIAFADQDDVWLPDKLSNAMAWLASAGDTPALYCARQFLVNETLESRGSRPITTPSRNFPPASRRTSPTATRW